MHFSKAQSILRYDRRLKCKILQHNNTNQRNELFTALESDRRNSNSQKLKKEKSELYREKRGGEEGKGLLTRQVVKKTNKLQKNLGQSRLPMFETSLL